MFLNHRCKQLTKRQPKEHSGYQKANFIGILYNESEFNPELVHSYVKQQLREERKEISMLSFQENVTDMPFYFSKKNITLTGGINKDSVNYFVKQPFDFLISLNTIKNVHYKYVLALSMAVCKIGIYSKAYNDLLLMTLKPSTNPKESIINLIKYLRMI